MLMLASGVLVKGTAEACVPPTCMPPASWTELCRVVRERIVGKRDASGPPPRAGCFGPVVALGGLRLEAGRNGDHCNATTATSRMLFFAVIEAEVRSCDQQSTERYPWAGFQTGTRLRPHRGNEVPFQSSRLWGCCGTRGDGGCCVLDRWSNPASMEVCFMPKRKSPFTQVNRRV